MFDGAPPTASPQDWAPYPRLDDAVRAYIRDADAALEALNGVLDPAAIWRSPASGCHRPRPGASRCGRRSPSPTGGGWSCGTATTRPTTTAPTSLMFSSSVRTIPLSAIVDQGLRNRFRTEPDGSRTMHAVMLYLSTQTPERSMTELTEANETRTVQYVETYRFSKSVTDGGLAQMQRLLQFGRALSHLAGLPGTCTGRLRPGSGGP